MGLAAVATSCEEVSDENPVFKSPTEFVLDAPAYGEALELANADSITFTYSKPDYGFAAGVTYTLQLSTDNFQNEETTQTYSTTSSSEELKIAARDFNQLACNALGVEDAGSIPSGAIDVQVRITACISVAAELSTVNSNVETINVVLFYEEPTLEQPSKMFMIGNFCGWDWGNSANMVMVNGNPGFFWTIRYVRAGEGFKFNSDNSWSGTEFGYNTAGVTVATSAAGTVSADGDGNFVIETGGWYIFTVRTSINGQSYEYEVNIYEPNVYVYGAAAGGIWANDDAWKFEVVDDPDAEWPFVSPKVAATSGTDDSHLRLCIHPDEWDALGIQWWQSEFIFYDGVITYRANGGDQARIANAEGRVYLNFVTGAAKVE